MKASKATVRRATRDTEGTAREVENGMGERSVAPRISGPADEARVEEVPTEGNMGGRTASVLSSGDSSLSRPLPEGCMSI